MIGIEAPVDVSLAARWGVQAGYEGGMPEV